jgi:pyruvate formate lyase activating enzyme
MSLRIHSIESFGTNEGPGIRVVVFLQGCHFRCVHCHNPDTWALDAGREIEVEEVLAQLRRQRPYLRHGGLTVSGGEPLIQRQGLLELFTRAQAEGFHTALDTNGHALDDDTKKLLAVTNLTILDVKHIDEAQHIQVTGQGNEPVLKFADYLEEARRPYWLRYVLVPGWTDQAAALHAWGQRFTGCTSLERVEILPFHTLGAYKYDNLKIPNPLSGLKPPAKEVVEQAREIFAQYFPLVVVR